jgi:hypothetical protein
LTARQEAEYFLQIVFFQTQAAQEVEWEWMW